MIGRGKIVAQGTKDEMLAQPRHNRPALDAGALDEALADAGLSFTETSEGALLVDAEAVAVGRAARPARSCCSSSARPAAAGLEEMFLQLTADDARDGCPVRGHPRGGARMSTLTATAPRTVPKQIPGVPMSRLVKVELRKLMDTRAGKWLLITIGLITLAAVGDLPVRRRRRRT